jgi:hypothetical protein
MLQRKERKGKTGIAKEEEESLSFLLYKTIIVIIDFLFSLLGP